MRKYVKANHVSIGLSLVALTFSIAALYRSSERDIGTNHTEQPAISLSDESAGSNAAPGQQQRPPTYGGPSKIENRILGKQQDAAASGDNTSKRADEQWHITYRGSEKVIDIGEPLDPLGDQLNDDIAEEVIQIGPDFNPDVP
jgi:hypothetical protein